MLTVASFGGIKSFNEETRTGMVDAAVKSATAEAVKAIPAETKAQAQAVKAVPAPLTSDWAVIATLLTGIIGFFATAGAAGTDFGMNNRDANDVQWGGLVGITGATIFAGGLAILIVAGANGMGKGVGISSPTTLMPELVGNTTGKVFMYLLAIAAFPPACFSSLIAANSFKTTLPKVNPFVSVGIGTAFSILLVALGWAGQAQDVFTVIGASFGPICGAMAADYLLAGRKWAGPRAGFNPAGWISWAVGFVVGAFNLVAGLIPAVASYAGIVPVPPLLAMVVGFVLYYALAQAGMVTRTLPLPQVQQVA